MLYFLRRVPSSTSAGPGNFVWLITPSAFDLLPATNTATTFEFVACAAAMPRGIVARQCQQVGVTNMTSEGLPLIDAGSNLTAPSDGAVSDAEISPSGAGSPRLQPAIASATAIKLGTTRGNGIPA